MEYNSENRQKRTENRAQSLRSGNASSSQDARVADGRPASRPRPAASDRSGEVRRRNAAPSGRRPSSPQRRPQGSGSARPLESSGRASVDEQRVRAVNTARSSQRPPVRNAKRPKKSKGFKRFIIIYGAILLLILIVGLLIFNSFIANYEKNQPSNIAKTVVEELSGDRASDFLDKNRDSISSIENTDDIINKYLASISGKELSYIENSDSRAEAPSFDIRADGATVGKILLVPDGEGAFNLKKWKLGSVNIGEYIPDTYSYTILAPSGSSVFINDNELPESAITLKDETPEILANAVQFIKSAPKYDQYTAAGLLNVPTVTAKDSSGSDIGVATAKEYFVAGGKPDDAFISDQKEFIEDALHDWAYHFIHYQADQTRLSYFIQSGCDLYSYIFGSDTMDPIVTTFYDWEYISNVEFTEFEVDNFIVYTDDCYSVDVKYKLKVDFNNDKLSDEGQMLDATWVVVNNNGFWGICDVIYHQGSEGGLGVPDSGATSTEQPTEAADNNEDATEAEETYEDATA